MYHLMFFCFLFLNGSPLIGMEDPLKITNSPLQTADSALTNVTPTPTSFYDLPNEVILEINHFLPKERDQVHLCSTDQRLYQMLRPETAKCQFNKAMAAINNFTLKYGERISIDFMKARDTSPRYSFHSQLQRGHLPSSLLPTIGEMPTPVEFAAFISGIGKLAHSLKFLPIGFKPSIVSQQPNYVIREIFEVYWEILITNPQVQAISPPLHAALKKLRDALDSDRLDVTHLQRFITQGTVGPLNTFLSSAFIAKLRSLLATFLN